MRATMASARPRVKDLCVNSISPDDSASGIGVPRHFAWPAGSLSSGQGGGHILAQAQGPREWPPSREEEFHAPAEPHR